MPEIFIPRFKGMHQGLPLSGYVQEDGAYARVLNNLQVIHGELGRRPGTVAIANPPVPPTVTGDDANHEVVFGAEIDIIPGTNPRFILFTERDGFLGEPGAWSRINPVHNTGTVTTTNGSTTVTGAGTLWRTRGIKAGDYFDAGSGTWYKIASVNSETQVSLQSAWGGTTGGGKAYEITRAFSLNPAGGTDARVFVVQQLGDLFVAGQVSGGTLVGTVTAPDGGVFKIAQGADANKSSWTAATDVSWVTSGRNEVEVGVDYLGDNLRVMGFGKLADGRLVMPAHFFNVATAVAGNRRVYYSSHLDTSVWTPSPGGFTDVEDYEGSITAAVFYSSSVSIHLTDGIELGELTGQDEPPLRFRPSRAQAGAIGPRMVVAASGAAIPGREIFLASDGSIYSFSGADAQPVGVGERGIDLVPQGTWNEPTRRSLRDGFAYYDGNRHEVAFCFRIDAFGTKTREVRINLNDGSTWRAQYPGRVNWAWSPRVYGPPNAVWNFEPQKYRGVILTRTDQGFWYRLDEEASTDAYDDGDMEGVYVIVPGIGAKDPHADKTLRSITVFYRATPYFTSGATHPTVQIRLQDGTNVNCAVRTNEAASLFSPARSEAFQEEVAAIYYPATLTPFRWFELAIEATDGDLFDRRISGVVVDYESTSDVRA